LAKNFGGKNMKKYSAAKSDQLNKGYLTRAKNHFLNHAREYAITAAGLLIPACYGGAQTIDDTKPLSAYDKSEYTNLTREQNNAGHNFIMDTHDFDSAGLVKTSPKTRKGKQKKALFDLVTKAEAGEDFQEAQARAKAIFAPTEALGPGGRVVVEAGGREAHKKYDSGRDLEAQEYSAGIRIGEYLDIHNIIKSTKAYGELGILVEGTRYRNRTTMDSKRALFHAAVGLFSETLGTQFKATLRTGIGNYSLETALEEDGKMNDTMRRTLADIQLFQEIPSLREVYGKARWNTTLTNYKNRAESLAHAFSLGAGIKSDKLEIVNNAFFEALITYLTQEDEYFNGAERNKGIWRAEFTAGAQINEELSARIGLIYQEGIRAMLELGIRF